eukprot:TRINITY_DN9889_c0_g1_i1.p2 TRINITY_DN9889_c0_g1~~TRINITY_DN9889_c0_g1_i1.p2  ORF type:complete len:330 (-),score=95.16 TRINITY_DN9889_c0_g1_i1:916-1905(-)
MPILRVEEDDPLLEKGRARRAAAKAREAARKVAAEQAALFTSVWGMVVGWAAGALAVAALKQHFSDVSSVYHNPVVFASFMALLAVVAVLLGSWGKARGPPERLVAVVLTIMMRMFGVMLGRVTNETIHLLIAYALGVNSRKRLEVQGPFAAVVTGAVFLAARRLVIIVEQPLGRLLVDVLAMLVAWAWADAGSMLFAAIFGLRIDGGLGDALTWAYVSAEAAYAAAMTGLATAVAMLTVANPLTTSVFGLTCGYGWKMALTSALAKEDWASLSDVVHDSNALGYLTLFAVALTGVLSLLTLKLRAAMAQRAASTLAATRHQSAQLQTR